MPDVFAANVLLAACGLAIAHTALGPDHYLPFLMLARARGWTLPRTLAITTVCGAAHVASSVLLGVVGLAAGAAVGAIESVEGRRGDIAAWAIVAFGVAYTLWGARRAVQSLSRALVGKSDLLLQQFEVMPGLSPTGS